MPFLHRIADLIAGRPGFLLPVFRTRTGANEDLIQISDRHDNVSEFEPVIPEARTTFIEAAPLEVVEGQAALWAFRDFELKLHIATARAIRDLSATLLESPAAADSPITAYELVAFCALEQDFPNIIAAAYDELQSQRGDGAEVWRDTVVMLPLVKEDLADSLRLNGRVIADLAQVVAVTRQHTLHVYASEIILKKKPTFARTGRMGKAFGIKSVEAHATNWQRRAIRHQRGESAWKIVGQGGIARFVVKQPPFRGSVEGDFIYAEGAPLEEGFLATEAGRPLVIGITASDSKSVATTASAVNAIVTGRAAAVHIVNIRPIGFGTPSPTKLSATKIIEGLKHVDVVWIMANHRQRQTGSYPNSMSVANYASRYVKALLQALTWCTRLPRGRALLEQMHTSRSLALSGAAAYTSGDPDLVVRKVLYSMLCEDAYLHSAKQIVVLWPYIVERGRGRIRTKLGLHSYDVELVPRGKTASHLDVIGLAIGVRPSNRTDKDFRDFCISLLAGFEWEWRFDQGSSMVFENQGAVLQTWCVQKITEAESLFRRQPDFGGDNLVITNQTIPWKLRQGAQRKEWVFLHYSEIGRWMRDNYRIRPFKDM